MRELLMEEIGHVSGGHINGGNDPYSLSGTAPDDGTGNPMPYGPTVWGRSQVETAGDVFVSVTEGIADACGTGDVHSFELSVTVGNSASQESSIEASASVSGGNGIVSGSASGSGSNSNAASGSGGATISANVVCNPG